MTNNDKSLKFLAEYRALCVKYNRCFDPGWGEITIEIFSDGTVKAFEEAEDWAAQDDQIDAPINFTQAERSS